jgi:hypothetical protein
VLLSSAANEYAGTLTCGVVPAADTVGAAMALGAGFLPPLNITEPVVSVPSLELAVV